MSYKTVLTQIKSVPEECLEDISNYISYVLYRYEKKNAEKRSFSTVSDEALFAASDALISQNMEAYKELAK